MATECKEAQIPEVLSAVFGAKPFKHAVAQATVDDRKAVARLLKPDVDTWRAEFGAQLRQAGTKMLGLIHEEMDKIPPAARAYTLAVLVDKAAAMEARATMNGANVNIQINQFSSSLSKDALLDAIAGKVRLPDPPRQEPATASGSPAIDLPAADSPVNPQPPESP